MLWDAILDVIVKVATAIGDQIKALIPPVPTWVHDAAAAVSTVLGYTVSLGNWVPLPLFGVVVISVVGCFIAGIAIKIARIAASFVTLGGGGAG